MDQSKLNGSIISQNNDDLEVVQWQFQSDLEPYKQTDPAKWSWQNYLDDENLIIEEAYSLNQETVFLKDYEIDLKKMVQARIQDKNKVRRIRRLEPSRFMMRIPEAKAIGRDPKTMNEAFGTVQHFLEYVMKRTPEAYTLYQKLKTFSLDCQRDEFEDLVHQVVVCIEKGAETRAKTINARIGLGVKDFTSQARKIKEMIENHSATLRDFLKAMLKVYTMETFVCYWLNDLLRSGDWEEINALTSYLVCLLYTFKLSDHEFNLTDHAFHLLDRGFQLSNNTSKLLCSRMMGDNQLGFVKQKRYLYRGAALTETQLMSYNPNKISFFSWNAVTSASKDIKVAQKFMHLSLNKNINVGVLFVIEINFDSIQNFRGMIDVSKNSRYPHEQEVILAPGTVFKLREVSLLQNGIYEICLKVTEVSERDAHFLGVLQKIAISEDKALINGLPSQQGFKMLELIRGNKLIRKLVIRNSGIEKHILQDIENLRQTTNVRKEDIELNRNTILVSSFHILDHYFSMKNFNDILALNKIRFEPGVVKKHQTTPKLQIDNLILKDETIETFRKNDQLEELWERLKNEIQTQRISLEIKKHQIEDNKFRSFLEHVRQWKPLENLAFTFSESRDASIENSDYLYQAISLSTNLNQLSLKIPFSDEELNILQNALKSLQFLKRLSFDFNDQNQITDEGLKYLKNALLPHKLLEHLSLNFKSCSFSDQGLSHLASAMPSLISLQHLSCDFFNYSQISIQGLNHLMTASTFLKYLKHFQVNIQPPQGIFPYFLQPSLETLKNLNHLRKALVSLTPLQPHSVNLEFSKQISDEEVDHLESSLKSLMSLQHLSLHFGDSGQISDEGLNHLSRVLKTLTSLQHLSLEFWHYNRISNEGLHHFTNALKTLPSLQYLSLGLLSDESIPTDIIEQIKVEFMFIPSLTIKEPHNVF